MYTTSDPRLSRRNFGRFFHAIKIPAIAAADGRPSGALTMIVYNVANGRDARTMAPFWRSKRKFWLRRHHSGSRNRNARVPIGYDYLAFSATRNSISVLIVQISGYGPTDNAISKPRTIPSSQRRSNVDTDSQLG